MLKNWIIKNKNKIIATSIEILIVLLLAVFLGFTLGGYEQYKNPSDWNDINYKWIILSVKLGHEIWTKIQISYFLL